MELKKRLEIASERFKEMEYRRNRFFEDFEDNGNKLSLELALDEQRQMDELMEAILKAKANL